MIIQSYIGNYSVFFFDNFSFKNDIRLLDNKFFVIDRKVYELYTREIDELKEDSSFFLVDAIEENKNVDMALNIIEEMLKMKSRRNTKLIAIGGGIVQDLAAFISNIIYRGIEWILIPTTLLAQADSCIGSKSSMNFKHYKNILGYFYPPTCIYINTEFLKTLSEKDIFSGLGEITKCSLMAGYDSFLSTKNNIEEIVKGNRTNLIEEIDKALDYKKRVIEKDEFDRDYRNIMNFGHTFGHALETTSNYAVPHGQAVSIGILIANEISLSRGYITKEKNKSIRKLITMIISPEVLKEEYFVEDKYLETLRKDKKYTGGKHTCILFNGDGVEKFSDVNDEEICVAVKSMLSKYERD